MLNVGELKQNNNMLSDSAANIKNINLLRMF